MFPKRSPPLTRDIRYFLEMYFVVSRDTRVDRIDVFDPRREDVRIDLRDSIPTMEKLRTSRFRGMDEHASSRVRCREVLLVLAVSPYDISLSLSLSFLDPYQPLWNTATTLPAAHPRIFYYKKKISSWTRHTCKNIVTDWLTLADPLARLPVCTCTRDDGATNAFPTTAAGSGGF